MNAIRFCALTLFLVTALGLSARDFDEEVTLFTTEQAIEFSRNTRGSIGIDSSGSVHVVYGIPDESTNPPDHRIYYQSLEDGRVSPPTRVDNAQMAGGRHPSMAIDSDDAVNVVWHDYRNTTASGNFIDNVEIYYDKKPSNGAFSDTDVRLTHTSAGHLGDNGYVPQICADLQNRLHVVWYDFTANGSNADIYLISTDEAGNFPIQEGIESFRITSVNKDPGSFLSNWLPDVAPLPNGSVYCSWGLLNGWQGAFELRGLSVDSQRNLSSPETITGSGGRFLDPARLCSDSQGDLALVSSEYRDGLYQVNLHYKPLHGSWRGPVALNGGLADAAQPCAVFSSPEELLVVWQEDLEGYDQVMFAEVDPQSMEVVSRNVASSLRGDARTPTIAVDSNSGKVAVAWIETGIDDTYSAILRTTSETGVEDWILH